MRVLRPSSSLLGKDWESKKIKGGRKRNKEEMGGFEQVDGGRKGSWRKV